MNELILGLEIVSLMPSSKRWRKSVKIHCSIHGVIPPKIFVGDYWPDFRTGSFSRSMK
jgi:hypothetical protein